MGRHVGAGCVVIVGALSMLVVGTGCGPDVDSISVTPSEINLNKVGASEKLAVEPKNRRGVKVSGAVVSFRSRDPGVASVSPTGEVTAVSHGSTMLELTVPDTDAMEFIRVVVRVPEKVEVRPTASTLYIGATKRLKAKVYDRDDKVINSATFEWSTSDESKARVAENGEVTGIDEGEVTITAKARGIEGSSKVRVTWAPEQKAMIEAEKRGHRGGGSRRGGGGGSGGSKQNWDPRLGMFE